MATRGRKSAASLSVVPITTLDRRPQPPVELNEAQAAEWQAVVARMAPDWFTRETHGLLIAYCKHRVSMARVSARIETLEQEMTDGDVLIYDKLLQMREREGRAMSSLATRMRITQQSRYNAASANTAAKAGSGAATDRVKPWGFGG